MSGCRVKGNEEKNCSLSADMSWTSRALSKGHIGSSIPFCSSIFGEKNLVHGPACDIDGLRSLPLRLRGWPTLRDICCARLASAAASCSRKDSAVGSLLLYTLFRFSIKNVLSSVLLRSCLCTLLIDPSVGSLSVVAHLPSCASTSYRDCLPDAHTLRDSLLSLSSLMCSPIFGLLMMTTSDGESHNTSGDHNSPVRAGPAHGASSHGPRMSSFACSSMTTSLSDPRRSWASQKTACNETATARASACRSRDGYRYFGL